MHKEAGSPSHSSQSASDMKEGRSARGRRGAGSELRALPEHAAVEQESPAPVRSLPFDVYEKTTSNNVKL